MRSASSKGRLPDAAGLTVLRWLMDNTGMKTLRRPVFLLPALSGLALLACAGLASAQDSRGAGVPSVVRSAPVALDVLRGRWVRPDGGYGVVIRSVGADGQLEAMYFNPKGLPFSKAQASRDGQTLRVFLELQAGGYNGSTYELSYDPATDRLEGFDIELLRLVSKSIFGAATGDERLRFVVMAYSDRLPALEEGRVDLVAHTMTINCTRWARIGFSATYLDAGQRLLVRADSNVDALEGLGTNDRLCVTAGSTSSDNSSGLAVKVVTWLRRPRAPSVSSK